MQSRPDLSRSLIVIRDAVASLCLLQTPLNIDTLCQTEGINFASDDWNSADASRRLTYAHSLAETFRQMIDKGERRLQDDPHPTIRDTLMTKLFLPYARDTLFADFSIPSD